MYPGFVLFATRQLGVPVILRELVLPDGFDPMSPQLHNQRRYHWASVDSNPVNIQII
ncbi:unnamed protein product [Schistosoma mattheei]|uniref:Uncharacterized protein n=1 Tax=Schistosoma mattheei TaxID=31246 RepID=A0A3P8HFK7_9TREM|nr:unnamed protein product [Schistosoma mattheei]